MLTPSLSRAFVDNSILLDGRLGLFHTRQRWLAVADLHFGYELSQRAMGNLFPLWGMQNIERRLLELVHDFKPKHLILLGDLVHDDAGANHLFAFLNQLQSLCEVVLITGNHDRHIKRQTAKMEHRIIDSWQSDGFYFHHGDCAVDITNCIQVIGHHHPTGSVRDGAGLRLKLPAFVQQKNCWILPAFSPWAGGTNWVDQNNESQVWLCSLERILKVD